MNILIYPHQLVMGGSQLNAIELAAKIRDWGHGVTVTAPPGILSTVVERHGLDFVPTPVASFNPSPRTALHLMRLVRERKIDLVHAYEWRPSIETSFGTHLLQSMPMVMTVLSMGVPKFLPHHVPLIVGTRELANEMGHGRKVHVMEPPIDTMENRPTDRAAARTRWGFAPDETVVAVVCRLTHELEKLEGVLEAIEAVETADARHRLRLLVVGDGEGFGTVCERSERANARLGRNAILADGAMVDPRPAYDAADIVIGMGSSALKGMAFAKPLVVQGTQGFWRLLDAQSIDTFLEQGWFGHGGGGTAMLKTVLERLADDGRLREELGRFGRQLVEERFSLASAAIQLETLYAAVLETHASARIDMLSLGRSAIGFAKFNAVMRYRSLRQSFGARGWA